MGAIIVPRRWEKQPPHAAELAPEYADAVTAFIGSEPAANLATGLPFTRRGSPLQSLSEFGEGSYSPAYTSRNWREVRTFNPFAEDWPGVTVLVDITCANISNQYPGLSSCAPVGEYFGGWNLTAEDDGSGKKFVYWRAGNSGSGLTLSGSYGTPAGFSEWTPGDRLIMCGTYDVAAGKLRLVWSLDNGKANVVEVAHSPGWRNASSIENIGGYERSGYRASLHPIRLVAVLPRALSANEQIALVENPWQLFKSKSIILPVTAGGGGGISQAFLAATETDLAQALTAPAILTFGAATEADSGLQLARAKSKAFTTSEETSSAQPLLSEKGRTFSAGNEIESAQALAPSKSRAFGQSFESDSAEAFVQAGATPFSPASEVSTAQAFAKAKVKALGQVVDGQTALALIARRSKAFAQAAETSAAQAISKAKVKAFSPSQETDNAQSLGLAGPKFIALGQVGESDTALPISREGAGQLPTGGGGGGRVGGAARVRSTRKLNELFEEIFAPTATVEQAVEKVEAAFKDKPRLEEVIAVIEEAERKAAMTSTETAVRRAKAVAKRLENLRRELEAEEEAVVTLLLL